MKIEFMGLKLTWVNISITIKDKEVNELLN